MEIVLTSLMHLGVFYFHSDKSEELYACHFLKQIVMAPKNR